MIKINKGFAEFKINEHITLKYVSGLIKIDIDGDNIDLCRGITNNNIAPIIEFESMDEFIETWTESIQEYREIDHEISFFGYCSNVQAWAENNYNSDLLHYKLAFPLLKKLVEIGDEQARKVFKEEIAKKIKRGYLPTIVYLSNKGYFDYLDKKELRTLLNDSKIKVVNNAKNALNSISTKHFEKQDRDHLLVRNAYVLLHFLDLDDFLAYLKELLITKNIYIKKGIKKFFIHKLYECVDDYLDCRGDEEYEEYIYERKLDKILTIDLGVVGSLLKKIRNMDHKEFAQTLVRDFNDWPSDYSLIFLEFIGERELITTHLKNSFIEIISSKIEYSNIQGDDFIRAYLGKEIIKEKIIECFERGDPIGIAYIIKTNLFHYMDKEDQTHLMEQGLPIVLESFEALPEEDKSEIFFNFIDDSRDTELIENYFSSFLETIDKLPYWEDSDYEAFFVLLEIAKKKGLIEKHFHKFFEIIDDFSNYYKPIAICDLIDSIKDTGLLNKHYSQIKTKFLAILQNNYHRNNAYNAFSTLLKTANERGWVEEHLQIFLETINKLPGRPLYAFFDLIESVKNADLFSKFHSQIETHLLASLEILENMVWHSKYRAIINLFKAFKGTGLIYEYDTQFKAMFLSLVDLIDRLPDMNSYNAFFDLIEVLKGTELINEYYSQIKAIVFSLIYSLIQLRYNNQKQAAYSKLIEAIKGTNLENESVFKELKEKQSLFLGLKELRERHKYFRSTNLNELESKGIYYIDGIHKECSFICTYEKISYHKKDVIYVKCGLGRGTIGNLVSRNAPICVINEVPYSHPERTQRQKAYDHPKYKIIGLSSIYGKPKNVIITDIEFFSDLDVRTIEESSKEQIIHYLSQEVHDAIDLYDKIARSFGKSKTIVK